MVVCTILRNGFVGAGPLKAVTIVFKPPLAVISGASVPGINRKLAAPTLLARLLGVPPFKIAASKLTPQVTECTLLPPVGTVSNTSNSNVFEVEV